MCTNILLHAPATPGNAEVQLHVSGRVMELPGFPMSVIYHVPRHQAFPWVKPPLADYHRWTSRYGFVAMGKPRPEFDVFPILGDGLNEAGLSCAALWHTGITYPQADAPNDGCLLYTDFVAWALGNFASIAEMEKALRRGEVQVVGPPPDVAQLVYLPLHFIATDNTGASLVVEFVGGGMQLYGPSFYDKLQDPLGTYANGALTNAPSYDWHCTNLLNYSHLTSIGSKTSAHGTGPIVGSGLVGLPGDSTQAARFVRAVMMQQSVGLLADDGEGWLPAPWHPNLPGRPHGYAGPVQALVNMTLQAVQVVMATPYGTLLIEDNPREGSASPMLQVGDWSDWTVVRDHTNAALYYVSGFNNIPQAIHLAELEFDPARSDSHFPDYPSIALLPPPPDLPWYQAATTSFRLPG